MRLIKNTFAAVILLGIAWILGMRYSAPNRHNREFKSKLPLFQKVVSDLQTSETAPSTSLTEVPVPENARSKVYFILAEHPAEGRLAVEFLTGRGFPVKHSGFLFLSSGRIEDFPKMVSRWPYQERLQDNWLYICD